MAAAGGAIRFFPAHVATFAGFVFEGAGLTASPRTSPGLPTNRMTDDPTCHRLLSRWITQSDLMFLNRISVPGCFQIRDSNRRRFSFWKFHCCFRARRPRRHHPNNNNTMKPAGRKTLVKKNVAHFKCGKGYAIIADSLLRDFLRFVHPPRQH